MARDPQVRWEGEALRHWLARPAPQTAFRPWLLLLGGLAGSTIILGVLYALGLAPAFWIGTFGPTSCSTPTSTRPWGHCSLRRFISKRRRPVPRCLVVFRDLSPRRTPARQALCAFGRESSGRPHRSQGRPPCWRCECAAGQCRWASGECHRPLGPVLAYRLEEPRQR